MARKSVSKATTTRSNALTAQTIGSAPAPAVMDGTAVAGRYEELGATGLRQFSGYVREEWLRDLQGWRGLRILREMRDNDPIIGAFIFAIEMLTRKVKFHVEGETPSPEDQEAADFITSCMADMEHSWSDTLCEALSFLQYGWSVFEIVYKQRKGATRNPKTRSAYDDGLVGWRKFAGRAQETLLHWEFDTSGDAIALIQLLPTGGPLLRVPLAKALHFRTTVSKNNPEGRTILRNAYTSYYYKKRIQEIEAIGIERDLTGIPVMWAPADIMKTDADAAKKSLYESLKSVVRDVSRNQQEGFVLPMAYTVPEQGAQPQPAFKLELLATGGRRQFETVEIINRYDQRIAATVLADFILLGSGPTGSYALSADKTDMFQIAMTGFLDMIVNEVNRKAIPDLLAINGFKGRAKMVHGDLASADLTVLGSFISSMVGSGVLIPDDTLEQHVRESARLPAMGQTGQRSLEEGGDNEDGEQGQNVDVEGDETEPRGRRGGQAQGTTASASDQDTGQEVA